MSFNKKLFLIALTGTLIAIFWQELNLYFLYSGNCDQPISGMIETADDASYLSPPKNFITQGVWADNSKGISRFYQRPPGYGMIYGTFYLILGQHAFYALKLLQISCFFLSIVFFGKILRQLHLTDKHVLVITSVFALLPIYSGFIYFSITEGITPFLVIWTIYGFISGKPIHIFFAFALLILVRPQLLFLPGIFLLLSVLRQQYKISAVILLSMTPFIFWMVRNTMIAGKFPGIHPIYSDSNLSLYRPGHQALTDLFRVWEHDGEHFHGIIHRVCSANNTGEIAETALEIPSSFRSKVFPLLVQFNMLYKRKDYGRSEAFKNDEKGFVKNVDSLRKELRNQYPLDFYIKTPFRSAQYLLSKSQLNLNIFQETFRGSWLMEIVRYICVILINLGVLSCFLLILLKINSTIRWMAAGILLYLFYLCFFQRMNEERYLTPILPVLLIIFASAFTSMLNWIKLKKDIQRSDVHPPSPL